MKVNESKIEQIAGIVLFVFSLLMLFVIIPVQIKDVATQGVSPRFMPQVVTVLIMILSVPLFVGGVRKKNKEGQKIYAIPWAEFKLVVITLLTVAVTIGLYMVIGFVLASILALAFLQYAFGQRNKWKIIIISVAVPGAIYMFFYYVLMISLPTGMLF